MTASREPRRPEKEGAEGPAKGPRKRSPKRPRRRLKHSLQDARHALKRAGRKVADPVRDAAEERSKRGRKPSRRAGAGKPASTGTARAARAGVERPSPPRKAATEGSATRKARTEGSPSGKPATERSPSAKRRSPAGSSRAGSGGRRRKRAVARKGGSKPAVARKLGSRERRRAGGRERSLSPLKLRSRRRATKDRLRRTARPRRPRRPARARGASLATRITGFGDRASRVIRSAAAPGVAALVAATGLSRRVLARLASLVTPLRAAVGVTALAAVLLGVSQFVDYRGVEVGVDNYAAYTDVEVVAPAPQVDRKPAGSAHAYLLLPVAVVALALLAASVRGHWQLGRLVSLLGLAAIAVSVLVDAPAGLDEGQQAVAYAGAEARLIEGFYAQVVSAAVLVVGGLMVSRYARRSAGRRSPRRRRAPIRSLGAKPA